MNFDKSVDGRSTPLGHLDTHSWHAVQCCAKCCADNDPGGVMGVSLSGAILSSITASPPSTFFFSCAKAAPVVAIAAARRNERRPVSVGTPTVDKLTSDESTRRFALLSFACLFIILSACTLVCLLTCPLVHLSACLLVDLLTCWLVKLSAPLWHLPRQSPQTTQRL